MKKILSIDGGGIRGIIPAAILTEIEKRTGKRCKDMFDLIAGTSTGGILACGLTCPGNYTAEQLGKLYPEEGPSIFSKTLKHSISSLFGLSGPKYTSIGLENAMKKYFKEYLLSQSQTKLLITAYDIESCKAFFFKSWEAITDKEKEYDLRDVAQATASGPVFFPPIDMYHDGTWIPLVDGGMCANNPAMCAYVEGLKLFGEPLMMVSLGTGSSLRPLNAVKVKGWGAIHWLQQVLNIFESAGDSVDYELSSVLDSGTYFRFQSKDQHSMDDCSAIPAITSTAQKLIKDNDKQLDQVCKLLTE